MSFDLDKTKVGTLIMRGGRVSELCMEKDEMYDNLQYMTKFNNDKNTMTKMVMFSTDVA